MRKCREFVSERVEFVSARESHKSPHHESKCIATSLTIMVRSYVVRGKETRVPRTQKHSGGEKEGNFKREFE